MEKTPYKIYSIIILAVSINSIFAQTNCKLFNITPYFGARYFYWGEYNNYKKQNLEEYGTIFLGGINSKTKFSQSIDLFAYTDFLFYYGLVNYNGYLMLNTGGTESYQSETDYWGLVFLLNMGYNFRLGRHFILSPELGVEYECWNRDVDNGGNYGYDEFWEIFFFDFGCNFVLPITTMSKIFLKILGKYPLIISESVNLASRGRDGLSDINLEPGSNIGLNLELGAKIYGFFLSIQIDYLLFSSSTFDHGFNQPRSDRSLTGLRLGYTF